MAQHSSGNAWTSPEGETRTRPENGPNIARMYNHALGGKDNFAADREAVEQVREVVPDVLALARASRAFGHEAIRRMARAGIRQFLDLGTGLPLEPTVQDVAQAETTAARVIYVANDPTVVAHGRALLGRQDGATLIPGDLRNPARVLADSQARGGLDLAEPLGLLLGNVLHHLEPDVAPGILKHYLYEIAAGSQVAVSVATREWAAPSAVLRVEQIFRATDAPLILRSRAQIETLLDPLELLAPGLVDVRTWLDEPERQPSWLLVGLGRRP